MSKYFPPRYLSTSFHCPHCQVFAHQTFASQIGAYQHIYRSGTGHRTVINKTIKISQKNLEASFCSYCGSASLWLDNEIIYPLGQSIPPPNDDLPANAREMYVEAGNIAQQSPRAACALLRLAIEMLLNHLGETGTISSGIKKMVKKGLDPKIEQALEIVRVVGNHAVHPGQIEFDDVSSVQPLFEIINVIAETLITHPKQIKNLYTDLPSNR